MAYIDNNYYELREDVTLNNTDFPTITLVQEWAEQATNEIERDLDRKFSRANYVDTLKETQTKVPTQVLFAKNTPIISLTEVTRDVNRDLFNKSHEVVDSVVMDSETGMIKIKSPVSRQEVKISYEGGYDTIPSDVKYLCYLIIKRIQTDTELRQEIGDDTTTSISSITVRERSASNLKNKLERLDKQIEDLKKQIGERIFLGNY